MRINVETYSERTGRDAAKADAVVVIDVLRCTSVMVTALSNGASGVIPTAEPETAFAISDKLGRENCVLGGERGCNIIPGFDAGNSPFEYGREIVDGKTVIMTTSNGTGAIRGCASCRRVLIGSMNNASAVARALAGLDGELLIVCAGTDGRDSADDLCTAGAIVDRLAALEPECLLSDSAMICRLLYGRWRVGEFNLRATKHCARLIALGYGGDVELCMSEDTSETVPVLRSGVLVRLNELDLAEV